MEGIPPVGAVERARDLLDRLSGAITGLRELPWWTVGEADLLEVAGDVEQGLRSGFGVQVRLAGELDERKVAGMLAARSTADLLRQVLNISPAQAHGRVAAARAALPREVLSGGLAEPVLPLLAPAIDAGELDSEHTRVITTVMRKIPARVDPETRALCEKTLIEQAGQLDPGRLRDLGERMVLICDPDGTLSGTDAADRAELHIGSPRGDGLTPIRGLLDALGVEYLRQSIEPLSTPKPVDASTPDPRSVATRRAQALVEVCRRYLATGDGPRDGGVRPQSTVSIDLDALLTGLGPAALGYAGPISAHTARLLACDAELIPQILGSDSVVLDQGRAVRLFPTDIRRAITTRDRGCTFPGCDIPAAWCQAHHIDWWERDLGPTSERNGTLLCSYHHHVVHQGDWTVRMAADRHPEFVPPAFIDPTRTPRRNHFWRLPDLLTPTTGPVLGRDRHSLPRAVSHSSADPAAIRGTDSPDRTDSPDSPGDSHRSCSPPRRTRQHATDLPDDDAH